MVSNVDVLEAQAFERRRLVSAFLFGSRDVEATSGVRLVAWGVVLGSLLLAGAAVARLLSA